MKSKKITPQTLKERKQNDIVITMLTAYDYPTAKLVDEAGIDVILVGDTLGMTILGYKNTLPVTMADMLHHCKAVSRGAKNAMLVGDMPFMSYQVSANEAVRNAGRFLQEAGMDAVKLEGGKERLPAIQAIIQAGIPLMGHIGLTPQSVMQLSGYRSQGKKAQAAFKLIEDAIALEKAGVFSIVLEAIPNKLGKLISEKIKIPTIGIGAGAGCDGQVLVIHDIIGMFDQFVPKFVKQYTNIQSIISQAICTYKEDVLNKKFPGPEHEYPIEENEWENLHKLLANR